MIRGVEERTEKREGERRERKHDGGSCLCQNRAAAGEGKTEEEREREREVSEQIETFSSLGSRLPCEVAGYIALSCKHALTAFSRRRRPSSLRPRPPPSRVPSSCLSRGRPPRPPPSSPADLGRAAVSAPPSTTSSSRPSRRTRKRLTLTIARRGS